MENNEIGEFRGVYRFLSNFWIFENPVIYQGFEYYTVENAYVAAKTTDERLWLKIQTMKPGEAKRFGDLIFAEELSRNPGWCDDYRLILMKDLLTQKFTKNPELTEKIIATNPVYIKEGNKHHDNFFGVCVCGNCPFEKVRPGGPENNLGKLLMDVREYLVKRL